MGVTAEGGVAASSVVVASHGSGSAPTGVAGLRGRIGPFGKQVRLKRSAFWSRWATLEIVSVWFVECFEAGHEAGEVEQRFVGVARRL